VISEPLRRRASEYYRLKDYKNAAREIAHAASYDYFVVNADIDEAVDQVLSVLHAERQRVSRLKEGGIPMLSERNETVAGGRRTEGGG